MAKDIEKSKRPLVFKLIGLVAIAGIIFRAYKAWTADNNLWES